MTDIKATLSGTVVVCCIHGREKHTITDISADKGFVNRCLCCENLFVSESQEPQLCAGCSPKIIGGENKVGYTE